MAIHDAGVEEDDQNPLVEELARADEKDPVVFYGRVWYDDNANSKIDEGEKGVEGAKVRLYRYRKASDGEETFVKVKSRYVQSDGSFEIPLNAIIEDSEYYLKFIHGKEDDYKFAPMIKGGNSDVENERGNSARRTIKYGKTYQVNAGLVAKKDTTVFYGRVWYDDNANSKIDEGEKGVEGAKVRLYRYRKASNGEETFVKVKSRYVESDGSFEIPLNAIIEDSEYYLKFIHGKEDDYKFAPMIKGGDSDAENERGNSGRQTVEYGQRYQVNAGLVAKTGAILYGRIWLDTDGDGMMDKDETGVEGAQISLFCKTADENEFVQNATVRSDGTYELRLGKVRVGKYYLKYSGHDEDNVYTASLNLETVDEGKRYNVNAPLPPTPDGSGIITGTVVGKDELPIAGASVSATGLGTVDTGADGRFVFNFVPDGTMLLEVKGTINGRVVLERTEVEMTVGGTSDIIIVLDPSKHERLVTVWGTQRVKNAHRHSKDKISFPSISLNLFVGPDKKETYETVVECYKADFGEVRVENTFTALLSNEDLTTIDLVAKQKLFVGKSCNGAKHQKEADASFATILAENSYQAQVLNSDGSGKDYAHTSLYITNAKYPEPGVQPVSVVGTLKAKDDGFLGWPDKFKTLDINEKVGFSMMQTTDWRSWNVCAGGETRAELDMYFLRLPDDSLIARSLHRLYEEEGCSNNDLDGDTIKDTVVPSGEDKYLEVKVTNKEKGSDDYGLTKVRIFNKGFQPTASIVTGIVSGTVATKEGILVYGATVSTNRDLVIPVRTDRDGRFTLPAVPEGTALLSVMASINGRRAIERVEVLVTRDKVSDVNIILDPSKHERVVTVFGSMRVKDDESTWDDFFHRFVGVSLLVDPSKTRRSKTVTRCAGGEIRVEDTFTAVLSEDDYTTVNVIAKQQLFEGTSCSTGDLEPEADDDFELTLPADTYKTEKLISQAFLTKRWGKDYAHTRLHVVNGNRHPGTHHVSVVGTLKALEDDNWNEKKTIDINEDFSLTSVQPFAGKLWGVCPEDETRAELDMYILRLPDDSVVARSHHRLYEGTKCNNKDLEADAIKVNIIPADSDHYLEVKLTNKEPASDDYGLSRVTVFNTRLKE